ncbi:MAG TPA: hypothetical protein VNH11_27510 [Pirellulales bacterium]|nr:hypothetical protein [Pirellulales bacterium]
MTLRDVILNRIDLMIRRELAGESDVGDLELKSDAELLVWYDRFRELSSRHPAARLLPGPRRCGE